MLTQPQIRRLVGTHGDGVHDQCVLWLATAYLVWLAVEREVLLIAAQPRLGIGRPPDIDAIRRRMVATIDERDGAALLAEIHLAVAAFDIEVAIDEQRAPSEGAPEGLLTIEVEGAMLVFRVAAIQGIVGTLEMAVLIIRALRPVERIEVETADEPHVLGLQAPAMHIAHMGLGDGIAALLTGERGVPGIIEVDVAEIAHREIVDGKGVAPEIEHGKVAHRPLHLPSLRGEHGLAGIGRKTDEMELFCTDHHPERFASVLSRHHFRMIRIVDPIDARSDK